MYKYGEDSPVGSGEATVIVENMLDPYHDDEPFIGIKMWFEGEDAQPEQWHVEWWHCLKFLALELPAYLKKACPCPNEMMLTMMDALSPEFRKLLDPADGWPEQKGMTNQSYESEEPVKQIESILFEYADCGNVPASHGGRYHAVFRVRLKSGEQASATAEEIDDFAAESADPDDFDERLAEFVREASAKASATLLERLKIASTPSA